MRKTTALSLGCWPWGSAVVLRFVLEVNGAASVTKTTALVSAEIQEAVGRLNQALDAIEPTATFWLDEALRSDECWEAFRGETLAIPTKLTAHQRLQATRGD